MICPVLRDLDYEDCARAGKSQAMTCLLRAHGALFILPLARAAALAAPRLPVGGRAEAACPPPMPSTPHTLQRDERRELLPLRERLFAQPLVRLGVPSGSRARSWFPSTWQRGPAG